MVITYREYRICLVENNHIDEIYYNDEVIGHFRGSILRNERKIKKIPVSKIAKLVKESKETIHMIEEGLTRPSENLLKKLASAYLLSDDYSLLAFLMGYISRNEFLIRSGAGYKVDLSDILCESDNSIVYYEGRLLEPKEKLNMLLAIEIIDRIN